MPLQISSKQDYVRKLIVEERKEIIILIGVIGSSKSFTQSLIAHSMLMEYPGSVGGFAKKNMTEINTGTIFDIMDAAEVMGVERMFTRYGQPLNYLSYTNKSRLQFHELDQTKDRNFNKTKKLQITFNIIDELDSITEEGFWAAHGRVGRKNNCVVCQATPKDIEDGRVCTGARHKVAPAFSLASCNPNDSWVKDNFYDKWKEGRLPDNVAVVEFNQEDSFLGKAYYKKYESSPTQFRKRYLENDWSYGDDSASLFKYQYLDAAHTATLDKEATKVAGLDVALSGTDRAVAALWQGNTLVDIAILKDKDETIKTEQLGKKFMDYCTRNGVGYDNASVDSVGNGEGVCDWLDDNWGMIDRYKAGTTVESNYDMLRSESAHKLAVAIEQGSAEFWDSCPYLGVFKKEATSMEYEETAKQLVVESKKQIKKRIGMSPDIFDAVVMGYSLIMNPMPTVDYLIRI